MVINKKALLARIAGDLKDLPSRGQAFQAKKGAPNTTIFEMVDKMPDAKTPPRILAHRTNLQYGSMEVWQKNGNNGVIFVPRTKPKCCLTMAGKWSGQKAAYSWKVKQAAFSFVSLLLPGQTAPKPKLLTI